MWHLALQHVWNQCGITTLMFNSGWDITYSYFAYQLPKDRWTLVCATGFSLPCSFATVLIRLAVACPPVRLPQTALGQPYVSRYCWSWRKRILHRCPAHHKWLGGRSPAAISRTTRRSKSVRSNEQKYPHQQRKTDELEMYHLLL